MPLGLSGASLGLAVALGGSNASPFSLPGAANLVAWWKPEIGVTLGGGIRGTGATPPACAISGDLAQTIGIYVETTVSGVGFGTAAYKASYDGGGTFFQTGLWSADVDLAAIGIHLLPAAGTFTVGDNYVGIAATWADIVAGALLVAGSTDSAKPTIRWNAFGGRPMLHGTAGVTGHMYCMDSAVAAVASGVNGTFTQFFRAASDTATPSGTLAFTGFGSTTDVDPTFYFGHRNGTNLHRVIKANDPGSAAGPVDAAAIDALVHRYAVVNHGTTVDVYQDGVLIINGASLSLPAAAATMDNFSILGVMRGHATNAQNVMAGLMGDNLIYDTDLSSSDVLAIDSYLATH